ncbi:Digeranylgeranylglyceryl phosphate synthase [ANME-1 cluster archaeon GoMg1]|nr:Digeranylgeranylglyceryl phosphate synthase [ANME-1 cluster archaeon GoMg1]
MKKKYENPCNLWLKIKTVWELTRAEHGLMYGCGVLIGIIIADKTVLFSGLALFGFFTAFLLEAGTFALNDYYDLESDIANQRTDRPLVREELRKEEALLIACVAIAAGLAFAVFLNRICFALAVILAVMGVLYDIKMKEFIAVSNFYIAATMAIPFIFGGLLAYAPEQTELMQPLLILAAIAFFAGFGREVMKDMGDVKGDEVRDVKSIARVYGMEKAMRVTIFSYFLAVVLSAVPFFIGNTPYFHNLAYIVPVIAADVLFVHTCLGLKFKSFRKKNDSKTVSFDINYNYLRKETLIALGIGLIAFVSGTLV